MYKFSNKSKERLNNVHPDLVKVMERAIQLSKQDFSITEGVRTLQRQKELFEKKVTQTLKSKHLIQSTGYGHAVDVVPYPVSWEMEKFYPIAEAVRQAAKELGVKITWGGSWTLLNNTDSSISDLIKDYKAQGRKFRKRVFIDCPHFELS